MGEGLRSNASLSTGGSPVTQGRQSYHGRPARALNVTGKIADMRTPLKNSLLTFAATSLFATSVFAQTTQPSRSISPLLQQLNSETQSLFETVRPGLVRVQLPTPKWLAQLGDIDSALDKYNLDPSLREKLRVERNRAFIGGQVQAYIAPSTQPGSPDGPQLMFQRPDGGFEVIAPSAISAGAYDSVANALALPRTLGLVFDDGGHVVIPVYIDPNALDETRSLVVAGFRGEGATRATFVAADRQTNLTVLKLDHAIPSASPARFAGVRPADGSLVMMLAVGGENGKLAVWTRGQQERGVVITVDGNIAGFARQGNFLDAQVARPVIEQLIQNGKVRRATLGVLVTESESPDGRRAMHVQHIKPGSAADAAGLREGDYILTLAGAPVENLANFAAAISARDGDTQIMILRDGKSVELTAKLHAE